MRSWGQLVDFLDARLFPVIERWLDRLSKRFPKIPWRSDRIEISEHVDGLSIRRVHADRREPLILADVAVSNLPVTLILSQARVLYQRITLPPVPAKALPALLRHEVSRHTPYTLEQVSMVWRVSDALPGPPGQTVDLWVLPLTQWQQTLTRLDMPVSRIARVDLTDAKGQSYGINLLPKQERMAYWLPHIQRALWVMLAVIVLAGVGMARIVHNRQVDVTRWQAQVNTLEQEARPVRLLKSRVAQHQQMQALLTDLQRQSPSRVRILAELNQCLPPDTVLDRLSINGAELTLDGLARSPEALISVLACTSTLKAPRLVGTLQADAASGLQRFSLQAELTGQSPP